MNFKDLRYKKFGLLQVIKLTNKRINKGLVWLCKCDCGNTKEVSSKSLVTNQTKSCGCLYTNRKLKGCNLFKARKRLYKLYKDGAYNRGYSFNLSYKDFCKLIKRNCFYCNQKPSQTKTNMAWDKLKYNGIDRIDNRFGYSKTNSVTCCKYCNAMKSDLDKNLFLSQIKKIYSYKYGQK